jgi:isopenicillin N synthase-like dioxygenase
LRARLKANVESQRSSTVPAVRSASISSSAELDRACREVGFYIIVGHGVDPRLIEQIETVSRQFFDLSLDEKMKVHIGNTPGAVGYAAVGDVALAYTRGQVAPPDLNESFQIAKVDVTDDRYFQSEAARGLIPSNRWPERPAALKAVYTKYYLRMAALAADLMRLSALALGLPETYFDDKIDRHISRLNVRLYPEQKIAPLPGQLRAAAHTITGPSPYLSQATVLAVFRSPTLMETGTMFR